MARPFTEADENFICDHLGYDLTLPQIAKALDRSFDTLRAFCRRHSLGTRQPYRRWSGREVACLRRYYGRLPMPALVAKLGRPFHQIYNAAKRYGLSTPRPPITQERLDEICRLHGEGLTDTEIAPLVGLCRSEVSRQRRRMKLPVSVGVLRRKRDAVRTQHARLGIRHGGDLRALAYRRFAAENGWPEDLQPREVQILNVLAARGVPMTRFEIAGAIGMRTDREDRPGHLALLTGNGPGGTYTASLLRRGLLLKLKRASSGYGQGANRDLYTLGPAALAILERRARCETTARTGP